MTARWLLAAGLACLVFSSNGRADLFCASPVMQVGEVRSGTALKHRFTVSNRGTQTIEITSIKPGCGCMRPNLDRPTLAPGEAATVDIEVNTVTQATGDNSWGLVVHYTEAGQSAQLPLFVRANLVREIGISPASVVLHTSSNMKYSFTLSELRPTPVEVLAVECRQPHIRAKVGEPKRGAEGWVRTIDLEVTGECPAGRHEEVLVLHTRDSRYAELKVPFTVIKHEAGKVQVSPSVVYHMLVGKEPLPAKILILDSGSSEPVVIEQIEANHPSITCTSANGPGSRATVRVVVDRDNCPVEKEDLCVRVHLSKPAGQTVTIPVRVQR